MRRIAVLVLGLCLFGWSGQIAIADPVVPEQLRAWVPWVLHGHEEIRCPALHDNAKKRLCAWPGRLDLALSSKGGTFSQSWTIYTEGWIALPGDAKHWPQTVRVDKKPALVMGRDGVPSIYLPPGRHIIGGVFDWPRLPQSLRLPKQLGLMSLAVGGERVAFPDLDDSGALWLGERRMVSPSDATIEDSLTVQVFRHLDDDLPMRLTTRIRLDVSGRHREVVFGPGLLPGFVPLALNAPLPARLEADGRIRAQVRPGSWTIDLVARHVGPIATLARPASAVPWPKTEVWVFQAREALRVVEIGGAPAIDPRQTALPKAWQALPAYGIAAGGQLTFKTTRRGDPEPAPDSLQLSRTLWLDFDGKGYSARDRINGKMNAGWRLEMVPPFALGRVAANGAGQLITKADGSDNAGVELRKGKLNLVADSRIDTDSRTLSAVGWDHDMRSLGITLNLPPGWRAFSVSGPDTVSTTWVQRWSMLDFFLVLIIALAVGRMWDWRWGVLALATLVLTYHEPGAPGWAWLHVLGAAALLRVMPRTKLYKLVGFYRSAALVVLIIIAVPFAVTQVRIGLYPQLEGTTGTNSLDLFGGGFLGSDSASALRYDSSSSSSVRERRSAAKRKSYRGKSEAAQSRESLLDQIDPAAKIQTGPGVPNWRQRAVQLRWNGPVERDQTVSLTLLPPWMNRLIRFIGVLLLSALTLLMLATRFSIPLPYIRSAAAILILAGFANLSVSPPAAAAELPGKALLDTLRDRLLETPKCFPNCAESPRLDLEIKSGRMRARMVVHAAENVAVPLPGDTRFWRLDRVLLDGRPAEALRLDARHRLWLHMQKGRHVVEMAGLLAEGVTLPVPLALQPRRVTWRIENGWRLEGVDAAGVPGAQLQLRRPRRDAAAPVQFLEPSQMPSFAQVERTLTLGIDWRVRTRVIRDRASTGAIVLEIPLLEGESVTTEGARVQDGKVLVNMTPAQRGISWQSTMAPREMLSLKADTNSAWTETWRLAASPIWRVSGSGLAPVFNQNPRGEWQPQWRPWPGETLELRISRPAAIEGPTLTIDRSSLNVRPGERSTEAKLTLRLRSSQGGQHTIRLPNNSRLDSVLIDRRKTPIRQQGTQVTIPVTPGEHSVVLQWRDKSAIAGRYDVPKVDLGVASVNSETVIRVPRDRWVLGLKGPTQGPAVLFWGVLLVVVAIAFGLGATTITPLRRRDWMLLGIGLTQVPLPMALIVVGWLFALGGRARVSAEIGKTKFNFIQVGLAGLTLLALGGLFFGVQHGLLGTPDMQISGNGSSGHMLRWYQDRIAAALPEAKVYSVPVWFYRVLMLGWALWLAFALLRWLRWGWECFATHGVWRSFRLLWWRKPEPLY